MREQKGLPSIALVRNASRIDASGLQRQLQAGQTLIEILLAFSVSILVLSAIIVGITTSLSNTQYTKNQNLANSYAKEAMAVARKMKESDWVQFSSYTQPTYCLAQSSVVLTEPIPPSLNCGQNVSGIFSRELKFVHDSDSCMADPDQCPGPACLKGSEVKVKVAWSDSKCPVGTPFCHKVELITCFSNIDKKEEP